MTSDLELVRLKRAKGTALRDQQKRKADAARTMLKALIAVAHDRNTPTDLRGMAFAVIKQAEAAGITTGEE